MLTDIFPNTLPSDGSITSTKTTVSPSEGLDNSTHAETDPLLRLKSLEKIDSKDIHH